MAVGADRVAETTEVECAAVVGHGDIVAQAIGRTVGQRSAGDVHTGSVGDRAGERHIAADGDSATIEARTHRAAGQAVGRRGKGAVGDCAGHLIVHVDRIAEAAKVERGTTAIDRHGAVTADTLRSSKRQCAIGDSHRAVGDRAGKRDIAADINRAAATERCTHRATVQIVGCRGQRTIGDRSRHLVVSADRVAEGRQVERAAVVGHGDVVAQAVTGAAVGQGSAGDVHAGSVGDRAGERHIAADGDSATIEARTHCAAGQAVGRRGKGAVGDRAPHLAVGADRVAETTEVHRTAVEGDTRAVGQAVVVAEQERAAANVDCRGRLRPVDQCRAVVGVEGAGVATICPEGERAGAGFGQCATAGDRPADHRVRVARDGEHIAIVVDGSGEGEIARGRVEALPRTQGDAIADRLRVGRVVDDAARSVGEGASGQGVATRRVAEGEAGDVVELVVIAAHAAGRTRKNERRTIGRRDSVGPIRTG